MIISEVSSGSTIRPVVGGFLREAKFDYAINPYIGCAFGCEYCYAASFTGDQAPVEPGGTNKAAWGEWVKIKRGSGEAIKKHASLAGKAIYMAPATDPYTPQERQAMITKEILEALRDHHAGVRLVIQTRGPLVVRDIELIKAIDQKGHGQVNMTLSTDNEATRRAFEPTAPSLAQRLKAIEKLVEHNVKTVVTVTPLLPITNVKQFSEKLLSLGLQKVILQEFHPPATGRRIRSTQQAATQTLQEMKITPEELIRQLYQLRALLEKGGVQVGTGNKGFCAPVLKKG